MASPITVQDRFEQLAVLGAAIFSVQGVGQLIADFQRPIDLAVPQVPLQVLQHFLQVGAQFRVSLDPHALGHSTHRGQSHGEVYRKNSINVTMRLTVLQQQIKALQEERPQTGAEASKQLESIKHLLWHGNTEEALERLGNLLIDLSLIQAHSAAAEKVADGLTDETYLRNNQEFIPNFGERRRQGETISTAFVESTINQVVSKRFVKKQQRQWTPRGAHLLLQTRTKVLNHEREDVFRGWYPQFHARAA